MQLFLDFTDSPEKKDVLSLIELAKHGNESACEELYIKYKPLIDGKYFYRLLKKYNVPDSDLEDARSIIKLLFMKSIHSYKSGKSKFITYFISYVKWKFIEYYSAERLIPVPTTDTALNVLQNLSNTNCPVIGSPSDIIEYNDIRHSGKMVSFTIDNEIYDMPLELFFDKYIRSNIKLLLSDECAIIYSEYIKEYIKEPNGVFKRLSAKLDRPRSSIIKCVYGSNEKIRKKFKIKTISIENP